MHLLPDVDPVMLTAEYWINRLDEPDAPLLDARTVATFNKHVYAAAGLPELAALPDELDSGAILERLPRTGEPAAYYDVTGAPLSGSWWESIRANMALNAIPPRLRPQFGLVVQRTHIRALPTMAAALAEPGDFYFDRLQEKSIDAGWPVAVLHRSQDRRWLLVLTPYTLGWVLAAPIALAEDRAQVEAYLNAEPFLTVIAPRAAAALPDGEHVLVQMGTRLPAAGQDALTWHVRLPRRDGSGALVWAVGYVARTDAGWRTGYAPAALREVFAAAFRMLNERYAWGGNRLGEFGRDCSRMVMDAWGVSGVRLPCDSIDQSKVGVTVAQFATSTSNAEKRAALEQTPPGALLYLPGHIMLYLGMVNGRPYAIHDLWHYVHPAGEETPVQRVVVSTLPAEPGRERPTLLDRLAKIQVVAVP